MRSVLTAGRPRLNLLYVLQMALILTLFAAFVSLQYAAKRPFDTQAVNVFGSFWDSGRAAWAGTNPYEAGPYTIEWHAGPYVVLERNLNPPSLLPVFQLLALSDLYSAARLWLLISAGLFVLPALYLTRNSNSIQVAWLFLLPIDTLTIGQIYAPLFALSLVAWTAMKLKNQVLAGVAIGLIVAAKPNFALWPMLLFIAGHWRVVLAAGVTATILFLLPALLYGPEVYLQWLAAVKLDNHGAIFAADVSLIGFIKRAGFQPLGTLLAASTLIGAAAIAWRLKPGSLGITKLALPLSLLCAPLAWTHYLLIAVPTLFERPWNGRLMTAAVLMLIPTSINIAVVGTSFVTFAGFLYLLPAALLAWDAFAEVVSSRERDNSSEMAPWDESSFETEAVGG